MPCPKQRKAIFDQIMGTCNRLGQARVISYIKSQCGGDGHAQSLTLIDVFIWSHDRMLSRVPTIREHKDQDRLLTSALPPDGSSS